MPCATVRVRRRRRRLVRRLFTRWGVRVACVVAIDLVLVVDVPVVDHVLVLVHERAAVSQDLHALLLPLHQFGVQSVDHRLTVLVLHQVVDILLVHARVILINKQTELRVIHEFIWVKFVHFEERLVILHHELRLAVLGGVVKFLVELNPLLLFDPLPFLFLVKLLLFR